MYPVVAPTRPQARAPVSHLQLFALFWGPQQGPKLAPIFQIWREARPSVPQQGGGHQGTLGHPQSGPR